MYCVSLVFSVWNIRTQPTAKVQFFFTLPQCHYVRHSCSIRIIRLGKNNELYNANEFYMLQNEILKFLVKILQSRVTYYGCKNLPSITRELPRAKQQAIGSRDSIG